VGAIVACVATTEPAGSEVRTQNITIFVTGSELGTLKPCGCFGGQLGGLDRRAAVLNDVDESRRLIIDTGRLVPDADEQNLIKFNIVVQAFALLGYDVVNLTGEDVQIASELGLLGSLDSLFGVISERSVNDVNIPASYTRRLALGGRRIEVTVAAFSGLAKDTERLARLFLPHAGGDDVTARVGVVIVNEGGGDVADMVRDVKGISCIILPSDSDEPMLVSEPNDNPLVIRAGRLGKYVGKLKISVPATDADIRFSFDSVPVAADLLPDESLVELYTSYQQFVEEADLLERFPRVPLPNGLVYTGSKSCKLCHDYEYEKWSTKRHAHAYATLEEIGSQYDPECVICHAVGMEYESGFISSEQTPSFRDVGCENCHGPGSEHIESLGTVETGGPMYSCLDCHTPEHSGEYAGNEDEYLEKIVHWREPIEHRHVK